MPFKRSAPQLDLSWIEDEKARRLVLDFHSQALEAYRRDLFIATVVLSGGVLEGILTFALMSRRSEAEREFRKKYGNKAQDRPSPTDWFLSELIDIASSLKLIGPDTAKPGAWAVKDFRNLIHPCKLIERSPPRWRALATGALAAIEDISASLSGRLRDLEAQP